MSKMLNIEDKVEIAQLGVTGREDWLGPGSTKSCFQLGSMPYTISKVTLMAID